MGFILGSGIIKPLSAGGSSPSFTFLNKASSPGGGGATVTASVTPAADAELLLIATVSYATSAGFSSLTANGFTPSTVLDQTYATSNGDVRFSSIPTSTTGTGSPFNVVYTTAANFKFRSVYVWSLKGLASQTAKTATYKAETTTQASPWSPATGINVDPGDLVFSLAFITSAASATLTASDNTSGAETVTQRDGNALSDLVTEATMANSHTGYRMSYAWTAAANKAGAFACVSYA